VLTASDGNAGFDLEDQCVDRARFRGQLFCAVDLGQISIDSTSATDAIILGLFDSLPGMMFTS
jgi:hypothetical protein